jgi:hypothetical protein
MTQSLKSLDTQKLLCCFDLNITGKDAENGHVYNDWNIND